MKPRQGQEISSERPLTPSPHPGKAIVIHFPRLFAFLSHFSVLVSCFLSFFGPVGPAPNRIPLQPTSPPRVSCPPGSMPVRPKGQAGMGYIAIGDKIAER